jgi:hypothetical protein
MLYVIAHNLQQVSNIGSPLSYSTRGRCLTAYFEWLGQVHASRFSAFLLYLNQIISKTEI